MVCPVCVCVCVGRRGGGVQAMGVGVEKAR